MRARMAPQGVAAFWATERAPEFEAQLADLAWGEWSYASVQTPVRLGEPPLECFIYVLARCDRGAVGGGCGGAFDVRPAAAAWPCAGRTPATALLLPRVRPLERLGHRIERRRRRRRPLAPPPARRPGRRLLLALLDRPLAQPDAALIVDVDDLDAHLVARLVVARQIDAAPQPGLRLGQQTAHPGAERREIDEDPEALDRAHPALDDLADHCVVRRRAAAPGAPRRAARARCAAARGSMREMRTVSSWPTCGVLSDVPRSPARGRAAVRRRRSRGPAVRTARAACTARRAAAPRCPGRASRRRRIRSPA